MMRQPPGKYWGSERHEKWGHHWAKGCNPHWPNGSRHCQEMGRNRGEYEHVMIWYEIMSYSTPFISILLPYSVLYYNITLFISTCIHVSLRDSMIIKFPSQSSNILTHHGGGFWLCFRPLRVEDQKLPSFWPVVKENIWHCLKEIPSSNVASWEIPELAMRVCWKKIQPATFESERVP